MREAGDATEKGRKTEEGVVDSPAAPVLSRRCEPSGGASEWGGGSPRAASCSSGATKKLKNKGHQRTHTSSVMLSETEGNQGEVLTLRQRLEVETPFDGPLLEHCLRMFGPDGDAVDCRRLKAL
ncbi:unnamed protein product [Heligmosomoides polygyrus]|uniref:Uncharacterized protein n=1 Tax=Heligmosomoides polygyrus TaxID=6339 RepID=A0A183FW99_HELPZ|nr:unnamed protein product [Heligmosomoides polygyrus]